jgi:hypothetical protein
MQRNTTARIVLAILGVCFLLLNPAGICAGAGVASAESPSHPCCPKPAADSTDSPCICIDRQPAAPTVPSLSAQSWFPAAAVVPALAVDAPSLAPESFVDEAPPLSRHAILLSIHQLLL